MSETSDSIFKSKLKNQTLPDLVEEIEGDFSSVIGLLNQRSRTQDKDSDILLDLAILVSLYAFELDLICRINHDLRPNKRLVRDNEAEIRNGLQTDQWEKTGLKSEFAYVIAKLDILREHQTYNKSIFQKSYTEQNRFGLKVITWQQLKQYQSYLKGFYFHSKGNFDYQEDNNFALAKKWYTKSLYEA